MYVIIPERFNHMTEYAIGPDDCIPRINPRTHASKIREMSCLLVDLIVKRASGEELERVIRHSMVVVDAYKHHLDYKRSFVDQGIKSLMLKYNVKI